MNQIILQELLYYNNYINTASIQNILLIDESIKEYKKYIKTYEESIKKLLDRVEKSNEIFKSLHDDMMVTKYKVNHSDSSRIWNTWSNDTNKKYYQIRVRRNYS
jgi:hypothetical protein